MASQYPLFTPVQYKGESTYGTSSSPDTAIGSVQNITPTNANNFTYVRANSRKVQKAVYGTYTTGLSGNYLLHDFTFLRHFVGVYDTGAAGTEADPYTLTIGDNSSLVNSAGVQAFSLEVANTIEDTKTVYLGCLGNDFNISGSQGQVLTVGFNIIAQKPVDSSTATSYTEPTTSPWIFSQAVFKHGATPSAVAEVESFNINYNNNLIQHWAAGNGRFMKLPLLGQLDITWTLTLRATSAYYRTLRDNFYGASNTPIAPSSSATAVETSEFKIELSEGTTRSADIYLEKSVIENISSDISITGDNIVAFNISGRSFNAKDDILIRWWNGGRS